MRRGVRSWWSCCDEALVHAAPGWDFCTIGDLAQPEKGSIRIGPFGSALKKHEYSETGVRVLGIEDVHPNQFLSDRCKYIPDAKFCELRQYEVSDGDVLVTNMGTVGRACVVPVGTERSIISSHLIKVSLNRSRADPNYLCWMLNYSPLVVAQIRAKSHGAIMAGFNSSLLKSLRIPLPPLAEQKRIARILDAADALRVKCREALAQLDTLLQSTFLDMFGDPVANSNISSAIMTEVVTKFIDYRGKSPEKSKGGIPLITAKIVKEKEVKEPNEFIPANSYDAWMRRGIPNPGDVVITTEAPMGEVALVPNYKAAFAQRLLILQPDETKVKSIYLMWALTMPFVIRQIRQRSTGSTVTGIRSREFKKITLPIPSLDLQHHFAGIVESVKQQRARHREHLAELDTLFASLQSRAFRGDL